jgi:hypothetical protein
MKVVTMRRVLISVALVSILGYAEIESRLIERVGVIGSAHLFFHYEKSYTEKSIRESPEGGAFRIFSSSWSADRIVRFYMVWFRSLYGTSRVVSSSQKKMEVSDKSFICLQEIYLGSKYQNISVIEGVWEGEAGSRRSFIMVTDYILH